MKKIKIDRRKTQISKRFKYNFFPILVLQGQRWGVTWLSRRPGHGIGG